MQTNQNASLYCDDWWDVTEQANFALSLATQVIKDIHLRQAIIKSQKYETIAVGIVQFFHLLASDTITGEARQSINNSLKNLVFFTHQNYLILIQIMLSRMVKSQAN